MLRILALLGLLLASAKPVYAEPPRVVTDIAPVHSLVAMIMRGVGEPEFLIQAGISPHDYALRPSDARNLVRADAVIWVGHGLTPALGRSIASLAENARSLELLEAPGTFTMPYRSGAVFGHDDADGHDANKADTHDKHEGHDHSGHEGHDHHGDVDVHAWQDPGNAKVWLGAIASLLSDLDPAHAETYRANQESASNRIDALTARLREKLEPLQQPAFVVAHDAFHYFENHFGLSALAAISPGDATQASAARLQAISRTLEADRSVCIFIEPQMSQAVAQTFASEHGAKIGVLDPIGATLSEGPDLYLSMLELIADGLSDCLN